VAKREELGRGKRGKINCIPLNGVVNRNVSHKENDDQEGEGIRKSLNAGEKYLGISKKEARGGRSGEISDCVQRGKKGGQDLRREGGGNFRTIAKGNERTAIKSARCRKESGGAASRSIREEGVNFSRASVSWRESGGREKGVSRVIRGKR